MWYVLILCKVCQNDSWFVAVEHSYTREEMLELYSRYEDPINLDAALVQEVSELCVCVESVSSLRHATMFAFRAMCGVRRRRWPRSRFRRCLCSTTLPIQIFIRVVVVVVVRFFCSHHYLFFFHLYSQLFFGL